MEEIILDRSTAKVAIDRENKIAVGILIGKVTAEDYIAVLTSLGEHMKDGSARNLIMNRLEVEKVDTEGRAWLKNVGFKKYSKEINGLDKFAIVKPKSTLGELYSSITNSAFKLFYPNLVIKGFNTYEKAFEWVTTEENKPKQEIVPKTVKKSEEVDYSKKLEGKQEKIFEKILNFLFR